MTDFIEQLNTWIKDMASLIEKDEDPVLEYFTFFLQEPTLSLYLFDLIHHFDEQIIDNDSAYYSACLLAFDVCVSQLQSAIESDHKLSKKTMRQLMSHMALTIEQGDHSLSFWLPILNSFYDAHVELSPELKNAYLNLATMGEELTPEEEESHLNSIRDLLEELSDLSVFDIAENFFAQSYAMPPDFFSDLVVDLYSLDEGLEVALLTLLHPNQDIRDVIVATHEHLMPNITLNSISLSRLQAIKNWYPPQYHDQFNHWIRQQRKKGVVFANLEPSSASLRLKASEVDGSGAQGIFVHLKKNRKNRLCGLLLKQYVGIKDAWITSPMVAREAAHYYDDAFDDSVMLRDVDLSYFMMMANHFLAITIEQGKMPDLHLLEIQEALNVLFFPQKLNTDALIEELGVQINPFTPDSTHLSLQRSKLWPKSQRFTDSWYIENEQVDKLVNRHCHFEDGVKVCRFNDAIDAVFIEEMEANREHWLLHFVWITLWLKARARKNEKAWQDSFFIAYAIQTGMPLKDIPIMYEICRESVVNSIKTMHERRTHLNQE
jgi:hypothetical protein